MLRAISVWVVFKDASNTVFPTIWDYAEPSSFRVIFSRHHAIWLMVLRNLSKGAVNRAPPIASSASNCGHTVQDGLTGRDEMGGWGDQHDILNQSWHALARR